MQQAALSPRVVEDIRRQLVSVENHLVSRFPCFREDIAQEAWVPALAAAPAYDPDAPGAQGYFYRVATLWVAENINRWLARTSLSRDAARHGVGAQQQAVDFEKAAHFLAVDGDAEEEVDRRGELFRLAHLRVRWRREADRVMARLPEEDAAIGALLFGLDGPVRSPSWVARHLGVWRDEVEAAEKRCRRVMKKWLKYKEQIEQLKGAIT